MTAIIAEEQPVAPEEIAEKTDVSRRKLGATIQKLVDVDAVEVLPSGEVRLSKNPDLDDAATAVADQQEILKEANKERLEQMRAYADISSCRREYLLHYFGDNFTGPCRNCDNCEAEHPPTDGNPSFGVRVEVSNN